MSDNKKTLTEIFSELSPKIVEKKEFLQRFKALRKAELSPTEKITRILLRPLDIVQSVYLVFKAFTNGAFRKKLEQACGDETRGFYEDPFTGKTYIHTGFYVATMTEAQNYLGSQSNLAVKFNQLTVRALNECEDFSHLKAAYRLKPAF